MADRVIDYTRTVPNLAVEPLDVIFQPALTWTATDPPGDDDGVQVVALLFLEYDPAGSRQDAQDFRHLVQRLTRWAWTIAGGPGDGGPAGWPAAASTVRKVLDRERIETDQLIRFLTDHHQFRIDLDTGTDTIDGTLLPMLPGLSLSRGSRPGTPPTFDRMISTGTIGTIRASAAALDVDLAPNETTDWADVVGSVGDQTQTSIVRELLGGYGRILIDEGIDTVVDLVGARDPDHPYASIEEVVADLPAATVTNIARMASRFVLHGLTIDAETQAGGDTATFGTAHQGIFAATGQQVPLSEARVKGRNRYRLRLRRTTSGDDNDDADRHEPLAIQSRNGVLEWNLRPDTADPPPASLEAMLARLTAEPPIGPVLPTLQSMPSHQPQNRFFALRQRRPIVIDGVDAHLHHLPAPMIDHLPSVATPSGVGLERWPGGRRPTDRVPSIDRANHEWVTVIELEVRPVEMADGATTEIYDVLGAGAVDQARQLEIRKLLGSAGNAGAVTLSLLGPAGGSGSGLRTLVSSTGGRADDVVLVRANLATDGPAARPNVFAAGLAQPRDFVELLWEAGDQRQGGFHLALPATPGGALVGSGPESRLLLLIRPAVASRAIDIFTDSTIVGSAAGVDGDADLVVANTGELVERPAVPPDHVGFVARRTPPTPTGTRTGSDDLAALYQLLGWRITGIDQGDDASVVPAVPGRAIGPTVDPGPAVGWLYEKLVPLQILDPPPPIGSAIEVEAWWLDVYGNRLPGTRTGRLPVRYTDPLIGVGQWPSLVEEYEFTTSDHGRPPGLDIHLAFTADRYAPNSEPHPEPGHEQSRRNRIEADLDTYRHVRRQLAGPHVGLEVTTSLDTSWSEPVKLQPVVNLVDAIVAHLESELAGQDGTPRSTPPTPRILHVRPTTAIVPPADEPFVPVAVELVVRRDAKLLASDLTSDNGDDVLPAYKNVARAATLLAPRTPADRRLTTVDEDGRTEMTGWEADTTLLSFARSFRAAFPHHHLAVANDRGDDTSVAIRPRTLHAVRFDASTGIDYAFPQPPASPVYYGLPPLANTLLSSDVETPDLAGFAAWQSDPSGTPLTRFEGVDLNVAARSFLVDLERMLQPLALTTAYRLEPAATRRILEQKLELADAISADVSPILVHDENVADRARAEARELLRQQLLADLVVGFDTETIIQHRLTVTNGLVGHRAWSSGRSPRIRGVVRTPGSDDDSDGTLRSGRIRLPDAHDTAAGGGYATTFTYLFDTKTPEAFTGRDLDLTFVPTEIEFDIEPAGIAGRQSSRFLRLVDPAEQGQRLGSWPIPIPLRHYPAPPSLILHEAGPDPDSLGQHLSDVREWRYTVVYEHAEVAQDSIDAIIQLNTSSDRESPTASGSSPRPGRLFDALLRYGALAPELAPGLAALTIPGLVDRAEDDSDRVAAVEALGILAELAEDIAKAWAAWTPLVSVYETRDGDLHYEIGEGALDTSDTGPDRTATIIVHQTVVSPHGGDTVEPTLEIPGFDRREQKRVETGSIELDFDRAAGPVVLFGDSSIPDRKLIVDNLDLLDHQNAWASVWLSRNRQLLSETSSEVETNPAFIFQTPAVRFNSPAIPFLTNDEPWDIAAIADSAGAVVQNRGLDDHLIALVDTLFPAPTARVGRDARLPEGPYRARFSCVYAHSPAPGRGLNEPLRVTVPVFLGLTVTATDLEDDDTYGRAMADEIRSWRGRHHPSTDGASLVFSVDLFSSTDPGARTGLPTLRITDLSLRLADIGD